MVSKLECLARAHAKAIGAFAGSVASYVVGHYALDLDPVLLLGLPALVTAAVVFFAPKNAECP